MFSANETLIKLYENDSQMKLYIYVPEKYNGFGLV